MPQPPDINLPIHEDGDCRDAAMNWLIRLREFPEDQFLNADFAAWLAASPENQSAWAEVQAIWDIVGHAGERPHSAAVDTADDFSASNAPHAKPGRRPLRRPLAGLALAASLALAILALPDLMVRIESDIATGSGESTEVTLPDGSRIFLAANSAAVVDYTQDKRGIRLLQGAVFVEVEPDPARPFTVHADGVAGTALGTAFEVRRDGGGHTVAVEHGIVRVDIAATGRHRQIQAAQWLHLDTDGLTVTAGATPVTSVASWRSGHLSVDDQPLADVVDRLDDYFAGTVLTLNDLSGYRVTGIYNLKTPESALRAALYPHGLKVRQISPWMLVISKI